jgi:hypothetical protein
MYEHSTAFYSKGEVHHSNNKDKIWEKDGLVAVVHHHSDGTRIIDWKDFEPKTDFERSVVMHAELQGQFKHDGGLNPEIIRIRHHKI